ncbi:non-ribosomal peptide synthetase/type I polyketide synthase [Burkholderia gladioli]|uniref:non-ribosomal peptide synthetase/type I polyketide synthase n=1 Tax=Burkholderia gladioli TaxID=28095 RepID=UPI0016405C07|nr:non-ribosomal peptide synthetase/type I polyketide synthase [Burkholderia gladioli]
MTDHHDSLPSDDALSIAIVGMAGRFPGAQDIDIFWEQLRDGVESIRRYDAAELAAAGVDPALLADPAFVPVGAFLPDIDRFDAGFFGFTPREAELTDPQQRLFLETAWAALEHAGCDPSRYAGPIGVYGGLAFNGYFFHQLSRSPGTLRNSTPMQLTLGNGGDFLASRVAYHLGLRGPAVTVQTACSTSLVAIHLACQSLLAGECEMALAGGVSIDVLRVPGYRHAEGDIRSRDGHCRAFDAQASGTVPGSGLGVVVLKPLERARADGDTIHAVIRGSAINNDGANKVGFTAPSAEGQAGVLAEALGAAGVAADSVSYVETHGTATTLGDPIEFDALRRVYGQPRANGSVCAIGSVKTNLGHLDAAAGVAGLIKTALALRHRQIPASLHFSAPNPHLEIAGSALAVAARTAPWPTPEGVPRRAGVSSFGIGGTNAHLVLEEAPPQPVEPARHARHLILLSARGGEALEAATAGLREHLRARLAAHPDADHGAYLADLAYTTQVGRMRFGQRRAVVAADLDEALRALDGPAPADAAPEARDEDGSRVMFLFPGQGAQHPDMGRALYERGGVFREQIDHCAAVLEPMLGLDLRDALYPAAGADPEAARARLERTGLTQPALFAVEYALARQWQAWGIEPAGMLGHSVGEYVAACLAGVFALDDALRIVATRGALIERLAGVGGMLAVHAGEAELRPLLGEDLWLAAVNGPAACSVSGTPAALAALAARLDGLSIGHQPLATSHAFHSGLLDPVLGPFRRAFDSVALRAPSLPWVSNLSGDWVTARQATDPAYWVEHLRATVRFADGLDTLAAGGPCVLLEVGPGRMLGGLARAHFGPRGLPAAFASLPHRRSSSSAEQSLREALGGLWRHGVEIDWQRYYGGERRQRIALPTYPFQRQRYWVEAETAREPLEETPAAAARGARRHAGRQADPGRWFFAPSWRRGTGAPAAARAGGGVHLLFVDRGGRVAPLVDALRAAGEDLVVVTPAAAFAGGGEAYAIDPAGEADYAALAEALRAAGRLPARISYLAGLVDPEAAAADTANRFDGVHGLHAIARAFGPLAEAPVLLTAAANGIHAVSGDEFLLPEQAAMAGPCRVIPLEYPHLRCRLVDVELRAGAVLDAAGRELLGAELTTVVDTADTEPVVALRGRHRWLQAVEPLPLAAPATSVLKPGGHYLVVGGAGGIGSLFAEHAARSAPGARLTLVGRSELPAPETWDAYLAGAPRGDAPAAAIERLRALRALGAEVQYLSADVADREAMTRVARTATARFGAIDGLVHAAAVAGGRRIAEETPANTEALFAPKTAGLRVLDAVFDLARADFVLLCSSLAAFAPIDGQSAYCAANAVLDSGAQALRARGVKAIAANWNTWREVGMARRIEVPAAFRDQLELYLSNCLAAEDGPLLFERLLGARPVQAIVTPLDYEAVAAGTARLARALRGEGQGAGDDAQTGSSTGSQGSTPAAARPALAVDYVAPASATEQALAEIWRTQFGIAPIGIHDDFFDLGGHSLLAVQVVATIRQTLQARLDLQALFDAPTIAGLAARIDGARHEAEAEVAAAAASAVPRLEQPITPRAATGPAPLSFAQQRLWFIAQLEGGSAAYHMPVALRLRGALDTAALQWAYARVAARHEALRTIFVEHDGEPSQVVLPAEDFALAVEDRPELAGDAAALERFVAEDAAAPFDLARGPLARARLLRLGEQDHLLLLTLHHIISDGWSMGVLTRELGTLYQGRRRGAPDPLAPLPVQYADYAAWQRAQLAGETLREHAAYWQRALAGAPARLTLPTDRPRPAHQDHAGAAVEVRIDAPLARALAELGRRHGATPYMTVMAGWALLLSRLAEQREVVIGTPAANRARPELAGLIGFFVNTLAIRLDLPGEASLAELLRRVRQRTLEAQAHQDLPFEQVVELVKPERDPSHSPLFQAMFAWQGEDGGALDFDSLALQVVGTDQRSAKFDLLLDLRDSGEGFVGALEYASALFDAATARTHVDCLLSVLRAMARAADAEQVPLDSLPLLDDASWQRLVGSLNGEADYPREACLHHMVEQQAARTPQRIAVVHQAQRLSYARLDARANHLAHRLRAAGAGLGARVAICAGRGPEMVIGLLAILKAGAAYVPLDPDYPAERLAYMLADSRPAAILADAGQHATVAGFAPAGLPLLAIAPAVANDDDDQGRDTAHESDTPPSAASDPGQAAYVIYTSGSTGQPKGVAMPHAALANLIHWQIRQHPPGGEFAARTLQFAALGFDVAFQEIFGTLCSGGELHLVDRDLRIDFPRLLEHLHAQRIERLYLPYVALHGLASAAAQLGEPAGGEPPALREVIVAGEQLRITPAISAWFARLPGCRLHNHYGPTESHVVTALALPEAVADWPVLPSIGRPLPNTRLYVLDARLRPLPPGMPGEICIGGAQVALGYLGRPALSAERFIDDPHARQPGARLYRTGDLGRWLPDGQLDYLGRNDAQLKLRGFRVEPGEVEAALSRLPGVREAAVAVHATAAGEPRLVAYLCTDAEREDETREAGEIAGKAGGDMTGATAREHAAEAAAWRAELARSLPDYMLPSHFVRLARLPVTPNGKLDRRALPAPEFDPAAAGPAARAVSLSPTEELLAGIWNEVLGIARSGVDDDFFALGGHSLLATRVISKARASFGVDLPIRALFEEKTLRGLARRIDELAREQRGTHLPAIVAQPGQDSAPLSFAQQRLWFIDQLERGSPLYNIPVTLSLGGRIDLDALRRAFEAIVARHASLRTRFVERDGVPVQQVAPSLRLALPLHELGGIDPEAREARIDALAAEEARRPFDLGQGPLLRASLIALEAEQHVLLLTLHHIVADGWSIGVLMRELAALYTAYTEGRPSPLAPLELQYTDFSAWQRGWLADGVMQRQLAYWSAQLRDAPPLLAFPTDRPRTARRGHHGEQLGFVLDAQLSARIRALCARTGSTLFMLMMAAFDVLLARYSGERDISVGTAIANRNRAEIEPLIGLFVNTLVIRTQVDPLASFEALLAQVRQHALDAYAHQDLPFEQVVDALAPTRSLSHQALFQMMLIVQNTPMDTPAMPGLTLRMRGNANATAKCDLLLNVAENEGDGTLACGLEYDTDLFDAATVERIGRHFTELLRSIVAAPAAPVASLGLVDAAGMRLALAQWNDTAGPLPELDCITRFEAQAAATPARVAIEFEATRLSYRELDTRAGAVAAALLARGIGREDRVAVFCARSADMMVAVLGIMKTGAAWVPLDPDVGAARLGFIVGDAAPKLILTQLALREAVPGEAIPALCIDQPEAWPEPLDAAALQARRGQAPDGLAYLIYTSGSTGVPKGVGVRHAGLDNLLRSMQAEPGIAADDTMLSVTSLAFDLVIPNLFLPLLCGARTVYAPRADTDDPARLAELMTRHGVTLMQATPATWRMLVEHGWPALPRPLRLVCGGEALSAELAERLLAHVPRIWNMYGPTETTVWSSTEPVAHARDASCIGRPLANTAIYLLDAFGQPVPQGATGELHIAGEGLARGYLGRAALTAERFVPDPFAARPGARMYRTGDHARRRPDGRLEYLGRIDNQLKVRGFRIEAGEIETALAALPGVSEAVVVARELRAGDTRLVAYVVPAPGAGADGVARAGWRAALAARLPDYMLPSRFVALEALPLTRNGKLDRAALPAPVDEAASATSADYAAPATPREQALAAQWAELLQAARVGRHDNFFELGGHSLLATQLVSRLRRELGIELPLAAVFEAPTLAALAQRLDQAEPAARDEPIEPVDRDAPLPLSFAQQRLWFLDQLQPGNPAYHVPVAARLEGELDAAVLRATFEAIVARHEPLRTRFEMHEGTPVQRVAERIALPFELVALDHLPAQQAEARARELTREAALAPFDLGRGPLLRVRVLRLAAEEHLVVAVLHHIVSDGWSLGVLLDEIATLYPALARGEASPLAPLAVQYADFAAWQRRRLDRERLQGQLDYWRGQLAGAPALLDLPLDHPRPAVQRHHGASHDFTVGAATLAALHALGQREQATLFMTLDAALRVLLMRYADQHDISLGTAVANRQRAELEPLIGLFINTLVLRTRIDPRESYAALLAQVRRVALAAYAHQDVPFEQVVDALDPERDLSHTPLFQVMLVLQNAPAAARALPGLALRAEPPAMPASKYDLSLYAAEHDGRLNCSFEYSTDLFDGATIERMAGHFLRLLEAIVADPRQAIGALPMLDAPERRQLLRDWNETALDYPRDATLHQCFERQAAATPAAPAVGDGTRSLDYAALNARANRLAHRLRALGAGPGRSVAICVERSVEMVAALLAVLKSGAAYVPIDPAYPADRVAYMLEDAAPAVLLSESSLRERLPLPAPGSGALTLWLDTEPLDAEPETNPAPLAGPQDLAYVIYTSGSTGRPKGVMVSHRNLVHFLAAIGEHAMVRPGDTLLSVTTLSFDIAGLELFAPLTCGAQVVLAPRESAADPARLSALVDASGATVMQATPVTWRALADHGLPGRIGELSVLCGGEALPRDLAARLLEHAPSVWNLYGPTETTIWSTASRLARDGERVLVGRPLGNTRVYLLDAWGQPVPPGARGELCIGGEGVARGYLARAGLTAERFVPDPFSALPGERMYRTGDCARYLPDGRIEHLGRLDMQVKLRGFRIEPGEIEAALLAREDVRAAAVVVRQQQLVAYVVPAAEIAGDTGGDQAAMRDEVAELAEVAEVADTAGIGMAGAAAASGAPAWRAALAAVLPDYMVPAHFVTLDALPLTPNGKLDRAALPAPVVARDEADPFVVAVSPIERRLARIWSEVLGVERIGIQDNFFQLGGDSILSIGVAERARRAGLVLAAPDLFRAPTIAGLARLAQASDTVHAEQGSVGGGLPPTPAQRHWLARAETAASAREAVHVLKLEPRARLDRDALAAAVAALLAHHDALRLGFAKHEGGWTQQHGEPTRNVLDDQADVPLDAAQLAARIEQGVAQVADLAQAPRLRVGHYASEDGRTCLVLIAHALVFDRAAWPILVRDLYDAYTQCLAGREPLLPLKTSAFAQWAARLAAPRREAVAQAAALRVSTAEARLAAGAAGSLFEPGAAGAPIALLAALSTALARWSGAVEVAFDLALRATAAAPLDLSRTLGCLTEIHALHFDVDEQATREALGERIAACLDMPPDMSSDMPGTAEVAVEYEDRSGTMQGDALASLGSFVERPAGALLVPDARRALALQLLRDDTGLTLRCAYDEARLAPASVARLLALFEAQLATAPAAAAAAPAFELAGLDAHELANLMERFGNEA